MTGARGKQAYACRPLQGWKLEEKQNLSGGGGPQSPDAPHSQETAAGNAIPMVSQSLTMPADGGAVIVPGGEWLLKADFARSGADLLLTGRDGAEITVEGYFGTADRPDLHTDQGAVISANLADRLAGLPAVGQYAQAAAAAPTDSIGTVEATVGVVTATRADGTKVDLKAGDPVFQGDVLETGPAGSLGVTFADKTTFSLGADGRMTVDEFIHDPAANVGVMNMNLVQGVFSFVSGGIAKIGPGRHDRDDPGGHHRYPGHNGRGAGRTGRHGEYNFAAAERRRDDGNHRRRQPIRGAAPIDGHGRRDDAGYQRLRAAVCHDRAVAGTNSNPVRVRPADARRRPQRRPKHLRPKAKAQGEGEAQGKAKHKERVRAREKAAEAEAPESRRGGEMRRRRDDRGDRSARRRHRGYWRRP